MVEIGEWGFLKRFVGYLGLSSEKGHGELSSDVVVVEEVFDRIHRVYRQEAR